MVLSARGAPLKFQERPDPMPGPGEVRVKVSACGVCRTDLHVVDGELPDISYPIIPGHEVVGRIDARGAGVGDLELGMRVGVPWLGFTCAECLYCREDKENLCDRPKFTGYTRDGGFASHPSLTPDTAFRLVKEARTQHFSPRLCAGLIGWRSLVMAGDGRALGMYGFGADGYIVAQVARAQGRTVYAFTRGGDEAAQGLALSLGADWTGASEEIPPAELDAAIIYALIGTLVPLALRAVRKGGRVVCAGIHMSDIPAFPYHILWGERQIISVANLARKDGIDYSRPLQQPTSRRTRPYSRLTKPMRHWGRLREGRLVGAAVLRP
jgi:propanol-preferring alcohol dehydrogenase